MSKIRIPSVFQRHPRRSISFLVLIIGIAALLFFTLGKSKSDGLPPAETPADTGALHVSLLPIAECLPFYVAEATGVYDSLGLPLVIDDRTAQFDVDTALYGQSAPVGVSDLVRVSYQSKRGNAAVVIAGLQGSWQLLTNPLSRAKSISELKDDLMGVARFATSDYLGTQALRSVDLDYGDMLRAQVNNYAVRANMLALSQIETAVLPEPYIAWALSQKGRTLWRAADEQASMGVLVVQPQVLKSKRRQAQVALLMQGYNTAVSRINRIGLAGCDTLLSQRFDIPLQVLNKAKWPRYHGAKLPTADAISQSRTFLSQRGVTLSGTMLMDDRFVTKK